MEKNRKILFIILFSTAIISSTLMTYNLVYNITSYEPNNRDETVDFLLEYLWDQNYDSFFASRYINGSFSYKGARKYASFNAWAVRALLKYSITTGDRSVFDNYALKALNFILNNMQNESNKGFYHWVYQNGSIPDIGHFLFNESVHQISTYHAWLLLTIIDVYKYTLDSTYITKWGKEIADFLISILWDSTNGGFYSTYLPVYDEIIDTDKFSWYQAWPSLALMNYYEVTGNETYMSYVNTSMNFLLSYLWDDNLKAFVYHCLENGTANATTKITLTDQAGAILALSKLASLTGNQTYWNNYIIPIVNFTKYYLWDDEFNQFYAGSSVSGTNPEDTNSPSDLSIWLVALLETIETLQDTDSLNNFLIPSLTHMNAKAWDNSVFGFFRKFFLNGTIILTEKWTIEQVLPLFFFCQYYPENPNYLNFYIFLGILIGAVITISYLHLTTEKPKILKRQRLSKGT